MIFVKMLHRAFTGDRFDAAHPRRHAAFLQDLDQPNLAGCAGVRSAAKFGREVADLDDPHLVAVLLSEQRHGVILVDRHIDGHIGDRLHLAIPEHLLVDNVLDILQLFIGDTVKCEKSKRRWLGATSDPACFTCFPSTSRNPACRDASQCDSAWWIPEYRYSRRRRRDRQPELIVSQRADGPARPE